MFKLKVESFKQGFGFFFMQGNYDYSYSTIGLDCGITLIKQSTIYDEIFNECILQVDRDN